MSSTRTSNSENTRYMTKNDEAFFHYNAAFFQIWDKRKIPRLSRKDAFKISLTMANFGDLSNIEQFLVLIILKHIKAFCFSTESQITTIVQNTLVYSDVEVTDDEISNLLKKMYSLNFVNFFHLGTSLAEADFARDGAPEDALKIYCLDVPGNGILSTVVENYHTSWVPNDTSCLDCGIIMKQLATVRYALSLYRFKKDQVVEFTPRADFNIGKRPIRCSARFSVNKKEGEQISLKECIFEVVRSKDLPVGWRHKINEQLKPLSTPNEKTGKFDFLAEAGFSTHKLLFVLLVEDEEDLLDVGHLLYISTKNPRFVMTTDKEVSNFTDPPNYWQYLPPKPDEIPEGVREEFARGTIRKVSVPTLQEYDS